MTKRTPTTDAALAEIETTEEYIARVLAEADAEPETALERALGGRVAPPTAS